MPVLKLYSTLIALKCDLLDGRCEGRWEGGSEDCRQDNPSKLSSAYDSSSCQHDETLFHIDCIYPWKLDGRCEYRWEGGSEDNPSKLSSAFAKYCILPTSSSSSLPSAIQTRNRQVKVIQITCKNSCFTQNLQKTGVGNAQSGVWEDLRDAGLSWHVNSPCKILLWGTNEFTQGLHNVT